MEQKLKALFDYQHFENNTRLARLIGETEGRCERALSDDELGQVSAAGEFTVPDGTLGTSPATADNWYSLENQNHDFEPGSRLWIRWQAQEQATGGKPSPFIKEGTEFDEQLIAQVKPSSKTVE